ncbi:MAG: hypothetical protein ABIK15_19190 [Pseudomonadota bacterium]
MRKKIKELARISAICICMFIFCCGVHEDGTLRGSEGEIISASKDEILKTQSIILDKKIPDNLPKSADGSVLFDGKVISVSVNPNGLYATTFKVDKVLFGKLDNKHDLTVYSPSPHNTGIDFKTGEIYRVLAVDFKGIYRTWDWLGTVKIEGEQ